MAEGYQIGRQPTNLVGDNDDRPAIHVSLAAGVNNDTFRWVAIGAEEEGVPCRYFSAQKSDPVAIAHDAAMSSRFGVGVGISNNMAVIHELHMPPKQPVITFNFSNNLLQHCRLAGGNAARLIIRLPFRFELEQAVPVANSNPAPAHRRRKTENSNAKNISNPEPETTSADPPQLDPVMIKAIAKVVAKIVQERGTQ